MRPSTISVGTSGGRPFSQRQVALTSPCPNCHGWMICVGLPSRDLVERTPIGFSSAISGMSASHKASAKAMASACSCSRPLNHRAPATVSRVQGGWKIAKSQRLDRATSTASPMIWKGLPSSAGTKSFEYTSCPYLRKAALTTPLRSHPIIPFKFRRLPFSLLRRF